MFPSRSALVLVAAILLVGSGGVVTTAAAQGGCGAEIIADEPARAAALRQCFNTRVVPVLREAETSEPALTAGIDAYVGWLREAQLASFGDDAFSDEAARGRRSLTAALKHAYGVRNAACRKMPGPPSAMRLAQTVHLSYLVGWSEDDSLFPTFDKDFAACMTAPAFRITVRSTQRDELHGTVADLKYAAVLTQDPDDPASFTGSGTYAGFVVSTPNATRNGATGGCTLHGKPVRFTISGALEPSATLVDLASVGGPSGLTYILATTDWPLLPLFADPKEAFARTPEDKEGVKGSGTVVRTEPVPLTGRVTELKNVDGRFGGECAGMITETEIVRIERMGR